MTLATKMSQVGAAIGYGVPKDGTNESQRYDYTSAARVRITVGPELAKRQIAVKSEVEMLHRERFTTGKGALMHHVVIRVTMTFVDGESGETMTVQALGEGMDSGDKASAKAMTMAEKYCYVSAFTLAMGEDPEADPTVDNAPMNAPLRNTTYSPEEQARADARAATDEALARGLIGDFTSKTHVDDAHPWVSANMRAIDALGEPHRKMVRKACGDHVKSGVVEGYSYDGYKEAWNAAVIAVRGPRGGKSNGAG